MQVIYTGKQEFLAPAQKNSLEAKLAKLGKLLDAEGKAGKPAHVIFTQSKNQFCAEITLNFLDHQLVGEHADADQFTAFNAALDKLEKQLLKVRDKRRDTKKGIAWEKGSTGAPDESEEIAEPERNGRPKVFRVAPSNTKPMTLDEAMMVIDSDSYLVYRNADQHRLSVLLRRDDGHFDLVEC